MTYTINPSLYNTNYFLLPSYLFDGTITIKNKNYSQQFINDITKYWAAYG